MNRFDVGVRRGTVQKLTQISYTGGLHGRSLTAPGSASKQDGVTRKHCSMAYEHCRIILYLVLNAAFSSSHVEFSTGGSDTTQLVGPLFHAVILMSKIDPKRQQSSSESAPLQLSLDMNHDAR